MHSSPHPAPVAMPAHRAWLAAVRPATLAAGAVPVVVGSALAWAAGGLAPGPALAALAVALLLQIGCNLVNDIGDFERGLDGPERLGPPRAAAMGWLSPRQLRRGAMASFAGAAAAGAWLASVGGWPLLLLGAAAMVAAVGYTAGKTPLGYRGLGDPLVLFFFGFVAVGGTYYVQVGGLSVSVLAAGGAIGALATAILVVNNLRDHEGDARKGKRTLAVRFGARAARLEYSGLLTAALALSSALALTTHPGAWLTWLALPMAIVQAREVWRREGAALNPLLGATARLELLFGSLLAAGVLL